MPITVENRGSEILLQDGGSKFRIANLGKELEVSGSAEAPLRLDTHAILEVLKFVGANHPQLLQHAQAGRDSGIAASAAEIKEPKRTEIGDKIIRQMNQIESPVISIVWLKQEMGLSYEEIVDLATGGDERLVFGDVKNKYTDQYEHLQLSPRYHLSKGDVGGIRQADNRGYGALPR